MEGTRKASFTSDKSVDQDDDDDEETKYCLDPKYENVRTPDRHVRTRLYFTPESYIHSLMNVLRYCNLDDLFKENLALCCDNGLEHLCRTKELDYMSYIVLRLFEDTEESVKTKHTQLHMSQRFICFYKEEDQVGRSIQLL